MASPQLSVVLATYNEVDNLARCLESVRSLADEVIVVDGSSTDHTRAIARQFEAKVFKVKNLPMFHTNKQLALNYATGDWVLQLDADEVVDQELKQSITQILKGYSLSKQGVSLKAINAFYLKRKNFFLGHWLTKGGQYPDPVIRLFRRGFGSFPQVSVHEQIHTIGSVATLPGHLLHYTAPTFSRYLTNSNRYTSLTAHQLADHHITLNLFSLINYCCLKPVTTFLSIYFRHKGFVDGLPGFIFALFSGLHWLVAYLKYWELTLNQKS